MNSLNILSAFGSAAATPSSPKDESDLTTIKQEDDDHVGLGIQDAELSPGEKEELAQGHVKTEESGTEVASEVGADEKTPLLRDVNAEGQNNGSWLLPRRIASAIIGSMRIVLTTVAAPGRYVLACFYDEDGHFSALLPLYRIGRSFSRRRRNSTHQAMGLSGASDDTDGPKKRQSRNARSRSLRKPTRSPSAESSTTLTSDSEIDPELASGRGQNADTPSRNTRSRSAASSKPDEIAPAKRSIKIKLHAPEAAKQRKSRKSTTSGKAAESRVEDAQAAAAASLKSPAGPVSKVTYPRAPAPPRPLIPRRQPSYSGIVSPVDGRQKTLIIDLDETLIHSMSKGGRYSTGHMVEVRLSQPVGVGGGPAYGPQVPILYYVHKRPYCDEFLRKVSMFFHTRIVQQLIVPDQVSKWYKLVVFTASVQEYADPVIDWLELERKYFAARYYRQHCTFRNGTYIKDLAQVEPDLSRVMILDNSPMSYIFHEGKLFQSPSSWSLLSWRRQRHSHRRVDK